jgi:hypothetical protein
MRMAADNTYLVDKKTVHGPKLEEMETLLRELVIDGGEKVVIFSQWLRMNELVEEVLTRNGIGYVHLNGSVPSKERKGLMVRFKEDALCSVFLSTDAGGVGLNLQSGSTVINMDIPWNPAILEQRIGRVHRMGQKRGVRVINFISRNSIEERILDLLRFKKSLFSGALDEEGRDTVMIGESQMDAFMRSVGEVSDGMEPPDRVAGEAEWREAVEANRVGDEVIKDEEPESSEMYAGGDATTVVPPIGELLLRGGSILMELGRALSPAQLPDTGGEAEGSELPRRNLLESLVGIDEATGKSCLKIPLPEPELISTVVSGLGQLLAGFMAGRK